MDNCALRPELLEGGLIGGRGLGVAKNFCVASGGHHTVVCCDGEVFTCGRKEYIRPTGSGERHRNRTFRHKWKVSKGLKW